MNKERLTELLQKEYKSLSTREKNEIVKYYQYLYTVKGCTGCKDRSETYFNKLKIDGLNRLEMKLNPIEEVIEVESQIIVESNFKLRNDLGVSKISFGNGMFISQDECADEVAIGFLEANPNRISMFSKFPENWKELITQMKNDME